MDSPNAIANTSTGVVTLRLPSASVPTSPPRWPSWNTQTSAPKPAPRLSRFITNALTGTTTDPVNRNSRTKVASTTSPIAHGQPG